MPDQRPTLAITIDSLAIHGLATFDAAAFSATLSAELTRLVTAQPAIAGNRLIERVQIATPPPGADSAWLGHQVAHAVAAQLAGTRPWS